MDLSRLRPTVIARWALVLTVASAAAVGALRGLPLALLVAAGAVLVFVVFLLWSSLQSLTGETELTLEEAFEMGAPSAEEERKQAVFRALKDLEYERSVGKITEHDYAELSARYRAEAKRLLRQLDEELGPRRDRAEADLRARLEQAGLKSTRSADRRKPSAPPDESRAGSRARTKCEACGIVNDEDARFCKGCGRSLGPREATS